MLNAYNAHIAGNGMIGLNEPMPSWVDATTKVIVLFTQTPIERNADEAVSGLLLSEQSLAVDWLRPEEDAAWAHLQ